MALNLTLLGLVLGGLSMIGLVVFLATGPGQPKQAVRAPAGKSVAPAAEFNKPMPPRMAEEAGPTAAAQSPLPAFQPRVEAQNPETPRKIVYDGEITLVTDDFPKTEERLVALVREHRGYVAQGDTTGQAGQARHGRWKIRVPAERFEALRAAVGQLGELQQAKVDTKDVTDEFYDLQARIKNAQAEEKSLTQLLEKTFGKMEDILTVRRELNRVREEIERLQGRLNLLGNLASLATLTVVVQERQPSLPPITPPTAAAVADRVAETFEGSVGVLKSFGTALLLGAVAVGPWLPVAVVVAVPVWVASRRGARRVESPPA